MLPRFANPAAQLAAFRIATFATLLVTVDPHIAAHYAAYPEALLAPPGVWEDILDSAWSRDLWHALITPGSIWLLYAAFLPTCLMATLGIRARSSQILAVITALILLGVAQFYGKVNHYHHLLWFAMLLALSPSADALALGSARSSGAVPMRPREAYEMPLRVAFALLATIYFFPGLWKVAWVGLAWAKPENVIGILYAKWAENGRVPPLRIDHWPWLCGVVGLGTIAFELAFVPAALAGKWSRRVVACVGVLFHVGIWVVMDIRLVNVLVGYLALVDVSQLFAPPRAKPRLIPPLWRDAWPLWPVCALGIVLVVGNIYDGIARREDWPLGMYPAFAWRAPDHHVTLEIIAEFDDGTRRVLTHHDLARHTTAERANATSLSAIHDDSMRPARQRALWEVWCAIDPSLQDATRVRFERVVRLVKPETLGVETERLVVGDLDVARN